MCAYLAAHQTGLLHTSISSRIPLELHSNAPSSLGSTATVFQNLLIIFSAPATHESQHCELEAVDEGTNWTSAAQRGWRDGAGGRRW
jgi:hypothetical protein